LTFGTGTCRERETMLRLAKGYRKVSKRLPKLFLTSKKGGRKKELGGREENKRVNRRGKP